MLSAILGVTRISMDKEVEHIKNTINHPNNYTKPCYIALGYTKKDAKLLIQKVIKIEDRIHMNYW